MFFAWSRYWSHSRNNFAPLVKALTGEFVRENLCSIHKFVCWQTTCRQLRPFFKFSYMDYRENLRTFKIFNFLSSSTVATKWNTAATKIIPLLLAGLIIWFLGCGKLQLGIQWNWTLNIQALTAKYRQSLWTSILAFRSCIQGENEYLLQFLSHFSFFLYSQA